MARLPHVAAVLTAALILFDPRNGRGPSGESQAPVQPANGIAASDRRSRAADQFPVLPLRFERNVGQADPTIDTLVHGSGYSLMLASGEPVLTFRTGSRQPDQGTSRQVRMTLSHRDVRSGPVYADELPGVSNYLLGDTSTWRTGVGSYARVRYDEIYQGIDIVFYGRDGELEYDFVVAPGADPGRIRFDVAGADTVRLDESGAIAVQVGEDTIELARPVLFQKTADGSRRDIDGGFRLEGTTVSFFVGSYDPNVELIIDPVLVYAKPVGPAGSVDDNYAAGVATDAAGNGYVFCTLAARFGIGSLVGSMTVIKLDPAGAPVYSTTLGTGQAGAIAVSPAGEVFVAGKGSFPDAPGFRGWGSDFSIVKLNAAGNAAVYRATVGNDISAFEALHLAIGPSGEAALTGATGPRNFTLENAVQPVHGGGGYDAFALALSPAGDRLIFSTYLGGSEVDIGHGVAIGSDGAIHVAGETRSPNFPNVAPLQPALTGSVDGFVTTFTAAGAITQSTFLGGSGSDAVRGIGLDAAGVMHLAGKTDSHDFPLMNPPDGMPRTAFLSRLAANGRTLLYSRYFGGSGNDDVSGVAADDEGSTYVTGSTTSPDFPLRLAVQQYAAGTDGFVAKFGVHGDLLHSTYLGGAVHDQLVGLAVGPDGDMYVGQWRMSWPYARGSTVILARLTTALQLSGVTPAMVSTTAPSRVTFTGQNFAPGASVFIGGQWVTDVTVQGGTSLSAALPPLPAGHYDVVIVNPYPYYELARLTNVVEYAACDFTVPATQGFDGQGGTRSIAVQSTPAGCGWWAESMSDWISVDSSAAGFGTTSVRLTVTANSGRAIRHGTLRVADRTIGITQGPLAVLDIDFDRKLDLIWHHQTDGRLAAWLMSGSTLTAGVPLWPPSVPDTSWKVVGSGDLNLDGFFDLVWQNVADGRVAVWLMNGLSSLEGLLLTPGQVSDTDWRIRAIGDLDGDGKPDLIWQHRSQGLIAIWIMDGLRLRDGRLLSPSERVDLSWRIVGSGDFNGDGHRDLVWQRASGEMSLWLMNGTTMVGEITIEPGAVEDIAWQVRAVGDIDRDGRPDLVLQHETGGGLSAWLMNGTTLRTIVSLSPAEVSDTAWHIVGPR